MKRFLKRFEDAMAAVAFAEAEEVETAKEILREEKFLFDKIEEFKHEVDLTVNDLTSMAITFAEAGEPDIAVEILKEAEDSVDRVKRTYQKIFEHRVLAPKMGSS